MSFQRLSLKTRANLSPTSCMQSCAMQVIYMVSLCKPRTARVPFLWATAILFLYIWKIWLCFHRTLAIMTEMMTRDHTVDFFAPEWFFFSLRYKDRYLGLRGKSRVNLYNTELSNGNTLASKVILCWLQCNTKNPEAIKLGIHNSTTKDVDNIKQY